MNECWLGAEYLMSGDGHRIILASLKHYIAKLETIQSPGYAPPGMFTGLVQQEAAKRIPHVKMALDNVQSFLIGDITAQSLIDDIPVINSAIDSYRFDIGQSESKTDDGASSKFMIGHIDEAKQAINKFE